MSDQRIQSFADAEKALQPYIPIVKEMTGKDITLDRMEPMMKLLGNPQESLRVIHVAGTSGKTSTSYYLASLLGASGATIGLTVSPHIDSIAERIQINLQPISQDNFCSALDEFLDLIQNVETKPSYFELLMAMAYWYFAKVGVDYAVIETGFGGLHDASNICKNKDKICVLTDIGFDHMHILGSKIDQIAYQKAGIMHPGNHAFCFMQDSEVLDVFTKYAIEVDATLHVLDQSGLSLELKQPLRMKQMPIFQQRNWLLAYGVYSYVAERDGRGELADEKLEASMRLQVPGRMDEIQIAKQKLILDGAHNEQKMTAFVTSFKEKYPDTKVPVLLGLKSGKEYQAVLPLLLPITSELILTSFEAGQDIPTSPIEPKILADYAKQIGFADVYIEENLQAALRAILALQSNMAIVTGSFYLLAAVRQHMLDT